MSILEAKNVSIRYITGDFKDIGIKEYILRRILHDYHVTEFWATNIRPSLTASSSYYLSYDKEKPEILQLDKPAAGYGRAVPGVLPCGVAVADPARA